MVMCRFTVPLKELVAYRASMGRSFNWVSSSGTDFNADFGVTFPGKSDPDGLGYNYSGTVQGEEMPGVSIFAKLDGGGVAHVYSTCSRGLDIVNNACNTLDFTMAWLRRHDRYAS
jgi:predicted dithiol-disulfide oxidoreductase (DUF899 family)